MNHFIYGIKREYWEHRKLLFITPAIATALFCLMAIVGTFMQYNPDSKLSQANQRAKDGVHMDVSRNEETGAASSESGETTKPSVPEDDSNQEESKGDDELTFWFAGVYLAFAWLGAWLYSLSSLYNDRQNKSILYWKTMPVSELQTVLNKYLFAVLVFSIVALLIAWVTGVVLMGYAHITMPPETLAGDGAGMSPRKLFVWPVLAISVGTLWCAPFFAYALYISAAAKKMPIMLFILPLFGLYAVEQIIFDSNHLYSFFSSHSPFSLLGNFSDMNSAGEFLKFYLFDHAASLILGLVLAGVFIWRAAWLRDHRFEI